MKLLTRNGFTLIELLLTLGIISTALIAVAKYGKDGIENSKDAVTANQMRKLSEGIPRYIRANFSSLYAAAAGGVVIPVQMSTIRAAGVVPTQTSDRNPFSQTYCVLVRRSTSVPPAVQGLEALLVTETAAGAQLIPEGRAPGIAIAVGASGGVVLEPAPGTKTIQGAGGGYTLAGAGFLTQSCSGTVAARGSVASFLAFDDQNLIAPFLYRASVPGHPEANEMTTNIAMGGNNINAANRVVANRFEDRSNAAFYVEPAQTSNMNNVTAQRVDTRVVRDLDDPTFFVDPAGVSRVLDGYVTARSNTVKLSSLLGRYPVISKLAVAPDTIVLKPACPDSGVPSIDITPRVFQPDTSGLINYYRNDLGGSWQIKMESSVPGVNLPPGAAAIVATSCFYP
jgi:prepilin-type N-terminal cleavage/methylation domain-containing protein